MWARVRAATLGFAALTLAACGNIHPGDAAVVDGHSISMAKFDKTARVYCELELRIQAQSGGQTELPNAEVRRNAIRNLVTVIVARDLAKLKGVTPDKQTYQRPEAELKDIAKVFPKGDDAKTIKTLFENDAEIAAIAIALAEQSSGVARTDENQDQLFSEGQAAIQKAFKDHDVKFSPRFGLSDTLKDLGPTGSLSVAEVNFEAPTENELPAAQRCA